MSKHVLVAIDGSPGADRALRNACERFPAEEITALYALDPFGHYRGRRFPDRLGDWHRELSEYADDLFEDAQTVAAEAGVDLETETVTGDPARVIPEYAAEHDVDEVVIGAHAGTGIVSVLLGSVAEAVVRRSPVPVTVVR
ncbi:universal stress protein [Natronorarus salvus]|uniref:universal stress protein n=1 Tax=Natronorarus salvus TaxID=3117733 RepID=UPI002F268900